MEYYGSSGILGLLPRSLTNTRMRDFTDAEFDIILSLISRLRPDLEAERTTRARAESGVFSRMRIWGRIIDMSQAGLHPLKDDFDFIQKDTNILLRQNENILEGASPSSSNAVMSTIADGTLNGSEARQAGESIVYTPASAFSQNALRVADFDTCGPPVVRQFASSIEEDSE